MPFAVGLLFVVGTRIRLLFFNQAEVKIMVVFTPTLQWQERESKVLHCGIMLFSFIIFSLWQWPQVPRSPFPQDQRLIVSDGEKDQH